jgi:peptide/nickel transport system permease protein
VRLARRYPLGVLGGVIVLSLVVVGAFAPLIAPHDVNDIGVAPPLSGISRQTPFGTDNLGRDMLSRVIWGARVSLAVGFIAVIGGTVVGAVIGLVSGYMGGPVDSAVQRLLDSLQAFPALVLLLIIIRLLGPSLENVVLVIGLGIIPGVIRIVRGAVLSEKNNAYVEAARAVGATPLRIMFVHIAPNIAALTIVIMTTLLGTAVLAEAALSFLGLGVPPPNPSWGADINAARTNLPVHIPWALFPGLAISLTVLGFNLLGDALRDALDPRLRGAR